MQLCRKSASQVPLELGLNTAAYQKKNTPASADLKAFGSITSRYGWSNLIKTIHNI